MQACGASERGTRILCDYLVIIGFLTKDGDRYGPTPDSAMFLDKRSPAYMGTAIEFMLRDAAIHAVVLAAARAEDSMIEVCTG